MSVGKTRGGRDEVLVQRGDLDGGDADVRHGELERLNVRGVRGALDRRRGVDALEVVLEHLLARRHGATLGLIVNICNAWLVHIKSIVVVTPTDCVGLVARKNNKVVLRNSQYRRDSLQKS